MNSSALIKQNMIQDYIMKINFKGDFSVSKIKQGLKDILKETPAVDVLYTKDKIITEDSSGKKNESIVEKVKSIKIAFSDGYDKNTPIVHTIEIYV